MSCREACYKLFVLVCLFVCFLKNIKKDSLAIVEYLCLIFLNFALILKCCDSVVSNDCNLCEFTLSAWFPIFSVVPCSVRVRKMDSGDRLLRFQVFIS